MANLRNEYDGVGENDWLNVAGWYSGRIIEIKRRQVQTQTDLQEVLDVVFKCDKGQQKGTWWLTERAAWRVAQLFKFAGLPKSVLPAGDVDLADVDYSPLVGCEINFYIKVSGEYGQVEKVEPVTVKREPPKPATEPAPEPEEADAGIEDMDDEPPF